MECKSDRLPKSSMVTDELIDTLWNVNTFLNLTLCSASGELIDTLWNVNSFTDFGEDIDNVN